MSDQYIVSARKYRPATFKSVVGQPSLTSTLKNAISSGRLAHAYLFCGPRGVGKTSCARIFAKTINCLNPTADGEACGECESCKAIDKGSSYNLMELDAASNNGVDHIRAVNEQVAIPPQVGKYRVFIIDEVHMLSSGAFNAFLKTLEEPPSYAVFILATTEKHKVLPTILSRCQIYDFKRITINDIVDHLAYVASEEGLTADRKALGVIARKADGAMRDALSIFDQVATTCGGNITYEATISGLNVLDYDYFFRLVDTFAKGDTAEALLLFKEIRDRGFDPLFFVNSLAQHVRDLMAAADPRTIPLLETSEDVSARLVEQARSLPLQWYFAAMKLLNDCDLQYRTASNKQLLVELALIRLCQLLNPATPPFDGPDRPEALRDPAQPVRATGHPAKATAEPRQSPQQPTVQQTEAALQHTPPTAIPQPATDSRPRRTAARPQSFSLAANANTGTSSLELRKEPFGEGDFMKAWEAFIESVPKQKILVSAMRTATPKRASETEYEVMVDHPAQQQAFEGAMQRLLRFLRDFLHNDTVTIKAVLNPEKAVAKFLSPHDFLRKTNDVNPELGEFLKGLDLELVN